MANTSNCMESPSRFPVDQVCEQNGWRYMQVLTGCVEDMSLLPMPVKLKKNLVNQSESAGLIAVAPSLVL